MERYLKKIEAGGNSFGINKISDEKFAQLSAEYNTLRHNSDKRMARTFKNLHYRKDTGTKGGTMVPLAGGRVGKLAIPVKKWKMAKRQLGRTKHSTLPIQYADPWETRFHVRNEQSTELFCDKRCPPEVRTEDEELDEVIQQVKDAYATLNDTNRGQGQHSAQRVSSEADVGVGAGSRPYTAPTSLGGTKPDAYADTAFANPYGASDMPADLTALEYLQKQRTTADFAALEGHDGGDGGNVDDRLQPETQTEAWSGCVHMDAAGSLQSFPSQITHSSLDELLYGKRVTTEHALKRQGEAAKEEKFIRDMKEKRTRLQAAATMTSRGLRELSCAGLCDYLDRKGFQHYTTALFDRGVTGEDLLKCDEFDLGHLGISFRPHRLKMLTILDALRGKDSTTARRKLTQKLTSRNLTQPLRPTFRQEDLDYNLVVSPPKLSAAEVAKIARIEAERLLNDKKASRAAKAAAAGAAHMAACLQRALEAYAASFELVSKAQEGLTLEEKHISASLQREATASKTEKTAARSLASGMYAHRGRMQSELNEANNAVDKRKFNARMAVISAARARASQR